MSPLWHRRSRYLKPSRSPQDVHFELSRLRDGWALIVLIVLVFISWKSILAENTNEDLMVTELAKTNQRNIAQAVASHTSQLVEKVRLFGSLLTTESGAGDVYVRDTVRRALAQDTTFLRLMLMDADGTPLFSTGRKPEDWLVEVARNSRTEKRTAGNDDIFLLPVPTTEYAAAGRLPFAYYPDSEATHPDKFTVALLDLTNILTTFGEMDLGKSGDIVLAVNDGRVLLRLHQHAISLDSSISSTQRFKPAFSDDSPSSGVLFEQDERGDERLYAYRRLEGSPLAVFVSKTRSEILATAKVHERSRTNFLLLITVIGVGLATSRLMIIRKNYRLARELAMAHGNNAQLLKQVETERQAVYRLATYDKLTGLPNRMLFADLSARHIGRAKRTNTRFAVMFIDLDRFKPINDTYGHKAGDMVLIEVAKRLQECVREVDVVSRHGGDEFVALLSDLRSSQDVATVANKIIESLSQPFEGIVATDLLVTPSIGIAIYPDDAQRIDDLVRQADTAMYVAKNKGRATFAFSDADLNRRMALSNEIVIALPTALAEHEIELYYQPKVRLDDFGIAGLEALARWTHPKLGTISPVDFIPVAEKSGIIVGFGEYVIVAACQQLAHWRDSGVPIVPVAVNVSWLQLLEPGFCEFIARTLEAFDLPSQLLELEITETGLVQAEGALLETLHRLRDLGLQLAIDDFGTGYSGLSKLRTLPARYVKIDKSFIQDIRNDTHDAAIVSNTISLSHSLGMVAIAEGVETLKQVAHLRAAGCDQAQGYFFSPPCDATRAGILLESKVISVRWEG